MRVIAGEFGRRKLVAPRGDTTRPTPDRLRESLFSILAPQLEGQPFADLYCGSGAVGIEALSRGASRCVFVENDKAALAALQQNIQSLGLQRRAQVLPRPVTAMVNKHHWEGIVFLDPPYDKAAEYETCLAALGENPPTLVLVQHDRRLELPGKPGKLSCFRQLRQGDNCVSFYGLADG